MTWTAGGGHCQTQVSTNTGRQSSDTGEMENQAMQAVSNTAQGWIVMDDGSTTSVKRTAKHCVQMSEVRI